MVRAVVVSSLVASLSACGPLGVGEVVRCEKQWTCNGDTIASEDTEDFCTDPNDGTRSDQIRAYVDAFAGSCDGVQVSCVGGTFATCAATCAPIAKECDIAGIQRIEL